MKVLDIAGYFLDGPETKNETLQTSDAYDEKPTPIKFLLILASILVFTLGLLIANGSSINKQSRGDSPSAGDVIAMASDTDPIEVSSEPAEPLQPVNSSNSTSTSLTVNGQNIPIPENGSVNTTVNSGNGSAQVSASSSQSTSSSSQSTSTDGQGSSRSSSNLKIKVNSSGGVSLKVRD